MENRASFLRVQLTLLFTFHLTSLLTFHLQALTGGLVLIAPGTAVQILFGALLALFYLLAVVRSSPFDANTDDTLEIFASLAIVLTLLAGFAIKADGLPSATEEENALQNAFMSVLLIFINALILAMGTFATFMATPCMEGKDPTASFQRSTEEDMDAAQIAVEEATKKVLKGEVELVKL